MRLEQMEGFSGLGGRRHPSVASPCFQSAAGSASSHELVAKLRPDNELWKLRASLDGGRFSGAVAILNMMVLAPFAVSV
jgi:hypothetical protein